MANLRITGMATGLDVDNMVKQLMQAERVKVDKVKQDRQYLQWKQDAYREILSDLNTFKTTYFDVLRPDSYILSSNSLSSFDVTSVDASSTALPPTATATAGSGAKSGIYSVVVNSIAKAAKVEGDKINATSATTLQTLGVASDSFDIKITSAATEKTITLNKTDKISDVINKINTAGNGVFKAEFSELTGKFRIMTVGTGLDKDIKVEDTSGNITKLGIKTEDLAQVKKGSDASVTITNPDGETATVERPTNTFTIDGVTYNLQSDDITRTSKITITQNLQKAFDKIKTFIDKYNEIVTKIQTKLTEKKEYSYKPLTDDQKKEMKEDEIKKWEEKAKRGILGGDSMLFNMLSSLRRSFFDGVNDAGITLNEIGLSTSSDFTQGGKIIIDESKLKDALKNKGDAVIKLLTKDSDIKYDPDHKSDKDRYDQIGIFQRINDILKDYTRTTRDSSGNKGILIRTAGITGDVSAYDNIISNQLKNNYDKRIKELELKLADKENRYYNQFAQLEKAMQKLNSQSSWLMQQLGQGGNY
ncbi:flagellar hook protein FliD [Fervidicella metallireducens AeB]|uniref:Flagellar hook-associated protein 2 n=1 Tax=Fervidicella metallireducens AeB TaxID=1403537 RepID=A0A017RWJ4_9CLOT|nr:flagellar filament capping protein FliD [Fervidicella metallireducens]EYE88779.1 flagellar hook protein FliD [Fervidicella metallireducens AeB]